MAAAVVLAPVDCFTLPRMDAQLWVGAAVTLLGVALGGVISLALNRQQMKDARDQRAEDAARQQHRASLDRRFQAYADFMTRARSYRNVVRDYCLRSDHKLTLTDIDHFMRATSDAAGLIFLVAESTETYDACRHALMALGQIGELVRQLEPHSAGDSWPQLRDAMRAPLRDFQVAARKELGVSGISGGWISEHDIAYDRSAPAPRSSDA